MVNNLRRKVVISADFIWMMVICSSVSIRWKLLFIMIPLIMKSGLRKARRLRYKNVNITGNEKTKDYVIRRELRTMPGENIQPYRYYPFTARTCQLGYFNQEKINPDIVPNQEDGTVILTGSWKKNLQTSWNFLQDGVVVLD